MYRTRFLFGMYSVRMSNETPGVLTDVLRGIIPSLQGNPRTVRR
jgi:hypothetical protein